MKGTLTEAKQIDRVRGRERERENSVGVQREHCVYTAKCESKIEYVARTVGIERSEEQN